MHTNSCTGPRLYAKCDVISGQNKKIQTEISHRQNVGAQNYKRTCITVLNVLSHNAIKFSFHKHFKTSVTVVISFVFSSLIINEFYNNY